MSNCMEILNHFITHPKSVNMTYFEHAKFSIGLSYMFASASLKALVHGIFPFLFVTSSTDMACTLNTTLHRKD